MSVRQVSTLLLRNNIKFQSLQRSFTGKTVQQVHPLQEEYKKFQQEDGIPVYLKGGFGDQMLFKFTVFLCFIGLSDGLYTLYHMAFSKKK